MRILKLINDKAFVLIFISLGVYVLVKFKI